MTIDELSLTVPNNDYDSYLKNMSEDGTWGDQLVLVALANALEKTIRVVTRLSTTDKESIEVFVESENQQAEGAPLLLGNLTENHYLSLEPIENIFKGICSFTF